MPQNIMRMLHAVIWLDHFKFASYVWAALINMPFSAQANGESLMYGLLAGEGLQCLWENGSRGDSFTVVVVIRWEAIVHVGHILKIQHKFIEVPQQF